MILNDVLVIKPEAVIHIECYVGCDDSLLFQNKTDELYQLQCVGNNQHNNGKPDCIKLSYMVIIMQGVCYMLAVM